jgi:hypothetical protein
VDPACIVNKNIGNIYTGSVFASLLSVVCGYGNNLIGKRIFMFSYGSGSMASMYRFVCQAVCVSKPRLFCCVLFMNILCLVGREMPADSKFTLENMKETVKVFDRLQSRKSCCFEEFTNALALRAEKYGQVGVFIKGLLDTVW